MIFINIFFIILSSFVPQKSLFMSIFLHVMPLRVLTTYFMNQNRFDDV